MSNNFWKKLKTQRKTFFALAPMADVTDAVFRQVVAKYGKPDILFTEFVACDGLCSIGKEKLMPLLKYSKIERPIIAQLFGSNPEHFEKSAKLIAELGFDGIDINMGCPQKNITKQGAGASLINNPELAKAIIKAAKRGAGNLPISIKTRIGYKKNEIEEWLPVLLEEKPAAITLHGRTQKEMSKVPANWDIIKRGVEIAKGSGVLILGNGDISSVEDGIEKAKQSGVDGVMIGQAIFGNPWLFNNLKAELPSVKERLNVLKDHIKLYEKFYGGRERSKPFNLIKKHISAYVRGFKEAKELRIKLMGTKNEKEALNILKKHQQ